MIKIYHVPMTRGLRPIWLCEELAIPYEVSHIDFAAAYRASPQWRALHPVGKVPVMSDGELTMYESGAMVQYLLDRYGEGQLQPPAGTPEHAMFLQWCWFAEATLARPAGEMVNHRREFPGDREIPAVIAEMAARVSLSLVAVAEQVEKTGYILGDEFSAADIMLGYSVLLAERLGVALTEPVAAYLGRLRERPACVAALNA